MFHVFVSFTSFSSVLFAFKDTVKNDLRTPLERKNSAEYRKTAKWLQNALIGIAGKCLLALLLFFSFISFLVSS